ncbi:Peptidase, M23/M37 family [hydrothermal vent metagenome]|uniref:Peptidase, M23/M37 family n=1 Tax=hydrothermal vent metagenome TaxID=652676 RepID=A0A3B0SGJ4_9ZZZZ
MRLVAALIFVLIAGSTWAQEDPAAAARAAAARLDQAALQLSQAETARNRVKALSETILAYEDGLRALRIGLRQVAIREQTLAGDLQSRESEISQLLGVLMSMDSAPSPVLLLHPAGPMGTARSGMIMAEVTPALNAQAADLREILLEVSALREVRQNAANTLQGGLSGAQNARTELSQAISERKDLPRRFTEDPVKTALLIASTETLTDFAAGLSDIAIDEAPGSLPGIEGRKGDLPLPVQGRILHRAGEADAAGIIRPGIVMVTAPYALVTTPAAATLRYSGPLLDYGNVIILEPQSGILLVLAGLDVVYGQAGEVLPGGSPVGLMGGIDGQSGADLLQTVQETTTAKAKTLYIEVRQDNSPVDPELWFKTDKGE